MNNRLALASLAMDLKRVAIGYQRGSANMARRFAEEALKRKEEIDMTTLKPYMQQLLASMPEKLLQKDRVHCAEDMLMLSTLLQNYTQTYLT